MWPQWSQEAAINWQSEQSEFCPSCGIPSWVDDPHAYQAEVVHCVWCGKKASAWERAKSAGRKSMAGLSVVLRSAKEPRS